MQDIKGNIAVSEMLTGAEHIVTLSRQNESEMLELFNQVAMESKKFHLLMKRNPRFFNLYDQRGGSSVSFGLRDHSKKLIGMASMVSTPCFVNKEKAHFAYLCDLRINCKDPILRNEWRTMFDKFLQFGSNLKEAGENPYLIAAVLANNIKARKLVEGQSPCGMRFVPIADYSMVNLLGRIPLTNFFEPQSQYEVMRGGSLEEIEEFLNSVHQKQAFGFNFGAPDFELRRRLNTWQDLSLDDFYIARDNNKKIIAVTALWNSSHCKQTIVNGPPWTEHYNKLGRLFHLPEFGKPLEFLYLTHLSFDWSLSEDQKIKVFRRMLHSVWPEKSLRGAHAISYCDFKDHSLLKATRNFFSFETKLRMYLLLPENKVAGFSKSSLGEFPPAFEMALA